MCCSDKNSIHLGRRCQSPRGVVDRRRPESAMTSFVYWLIDGSAQSVCHLDSCCAWLESCGCFCKFVVFPCDPVICFHTPPLYACML